MKIWTNTFDDIYGEVDAIKAEAKRLGKENPDKAEVIAGNAYKMIEQRLGDNGLSIQEWKNLKGTYEQYDIDLTDNPLTYAKGLMRSFGQGMLLGSGDELEAFFKHYVTRNLLGSENPDATYNDILLDVQAGMKAFQDKNPKVDFATEIIGGLAVPFYGSAVRGARSLTSLGAKFISKPANREAIAQGLTAGIAGTLYGIGKQHDLSLENALVGAGGGYVLNRALLGEGNIVRGARERVQKSYDQTGFPASKTDQLLAKAPAYPQAPDASVRLPPSDRLGGGHDPPGGIPRAMLGSGGRRTWDEMGMKELIQSADDEQVSFEELINRVQDYTDQNMGKHVTMLDVVKERGPIAKTIRGLTQESPQASQSYENALERQINAKKRIMPQIFGLFDPTGKMQKGGINNNIVRFLNKSKETRQKNAEPLYKQYDGLMLFDPKIDPNDIKNPKLLNVNAIGEDLVAKIKTLMDADDAIKRAWTKATGKLAFNDPAMAIHSDDFVLTGKRFNAFKKQLDGEIGKSLREGNLESVKDLSEYKNIMIRQVDQMVEQLTGAQKGQGVYQRARNIYSGGIAEDNAYELGKGAIREHQGKNFTSDEFEVAFDDLGVSERSFVRLGMGSGYKDALLGDMTELTPNVRKLLVGGAEPNVLLNKFDYAFKDMTQATPSGLSGKERAKEFRNILDKEGRFMKSFRYLWGGPGTAERLAESKAISSKMDDVVDSVAELGPEALMTGGIPKYSIARTITRNITPNRLKTRQMVKEKFGDAIWNRAGAMGDENVTANLQDLLNLKRQLDLQYHSGGLLSRYARPEIGAYNLLQTGPYTPPPIPYDRE